MVVYPLVIPSASEMAVAPICGLLVVLVIVVTWLTLIALISSTSSPSNPRTSVSRMAGLKVVSASRIHRVIGRAMGVKTRRRLVLNILGALENWYLRLSIFENNHYSI